MLKVPRAAHYPEVEKDGLLLCRRCAAVEKQSPDGEVKEEVSRLCSIREGETSRI